MLFGHHIATEVEFGLLRREATGDPYLAVVGPHQPNRASGVFDRSPQYRILAMKVQRDLPIVVSPEGGMQNAPVVMGDLQGRVGCGRDGKAFREGVILGEFTSQGDVPGWRFRFDGVLY
ncbi:hypothetical protein GCM10007079_20810 [Nocardiopsis terrae]|nr:hypothetical protein GCM10007079_20810 [Nocardiopsis terrae]